MRGQELSREPVTRLGRLAVLIVLMAGFLTMHGFLAVSASAATHTEHIPAVATSHGASSHVASSHDASPHAASPHDSPRRDVAVQVDVSAAALVGAPSVPEPAEHHDLVAGCVVALVGIAVLATAVLVGAGRLVRHGGPSARQSMVRVLQWVSDHAPGLPAPRVALCVIRV